MWLWSRYQFIDFPLTTNDHDHEERPAHIMKFCLVKHVTMFVLLVPYRCIPVPNVLIPPHHQFRFISPPSSALWTTSPLQLHLIPATWIVNLINKSSGVIISTWDSLLYKYKKYCWYFYKSVGTCEAYFIYTINFWYNHNTPHVYIGMLGFCTSVVHCNKRHEWDLKSLNRGLGWRMPRRLEYGKALTEYYAGIFTIFTLI